MISVCIATYNGEKYIKEQIESILPQLDCEDEIIISDDKSIDNTIKIINGFNDNRLKIIYNKLEKGYTNNFENAINNSNGDYIFLSDQDDIWLDNKVFKMVKLLEIYDFVVSDALIVNSHLEDTGDTYFSLRGGGKNGFVNNLIKAKYLGCCMAFRRELTNKIIPFPLKVKLCPHDFWISLISEFYYKTHVIKEPLILYRRHGFNVSNGGKMTSNSLIKQIKFRIYSFIQVMLRANK